MVRYGVKVGMVNPAANREARPWVKLDRVSSWKEKAVTLSRLPATIMKMKAVRIKALPLRGDACSLSRDLAGVDVLGSKSASSSSC